MDLPGISLIIPTHNRADVLADTLSRLMRLVSNADEIIVVDNGSTDGAGCRLRSRYPRVRWVELDRNLSCAARNVGAAAARNELLLMLDDDSVPAPGTLAGVREAFADDPALGAIACRIRRMSDPARHDAGGLAGVIVNCGAALRASAFFDAGGYPPDFDYYAEEYDLCCRLLRRGYRVQPRGDLSVLHARSGVNRNADRMVRLLVRNNLRVWSTYAPPGRRQRLLDETTDRYAMVARRERAEEGYVAGLDDWRSESRKTRQRPLSEAQFGALFGLELARSRLTEALQARRPARVALWGRGKGCPQLIEVLLEAGATIAGVYDDVAQDAEWWGVPLRPATTFVPLARQILIPGTLSPGAATDLAADLAARFSEQPIFSALDWDVFSAEPAVSI